MADHWHCSIRGSRVGPISSVALKRLADSGELSRSDLIWKEGLVDWVAASTVKGLFAAPAQPPPLPQLLEDIAELKARAAAAAKNVTTTPVVQRVNVSGIQPIAGFHIQRIAVAAAATVGGLATFMPWVTVPVIGTIYGTAGPDGWISLCLFIPAVVLSCLGDRSAILGRWQQYTAAIPAGIAAAIGVYKYIDFSMKLRGAAKEVDDNPLAQAMAAAMTNNVRLGIGVYLLILAGLATVTAVFILKKRQTA